MGETSMALYPIEILMAPGRGDGGQAVLRLLQDLRFANRMWSVETFAQVSNFLRRQGTFTSVPLPGLVILEVSSSQNDPSEILAEMTADPELRAIPLAVLVPSPTASRRRDRHFGRHFVIEPPVQLPTIMALARELDLRWALLTPSPQAPRQASRVSATCRMRPSSLPDWNLRRYSSSTIAPRMQRWSAPRCTGLAS